jgi:dihydrofolate synthase/folylpolyglutamate synthase
MQVNGESISQTDLVTLVSEIKPHVDSIPWLTTFEITTAVAFWYFQRQKIDIGVIEVGLGGRLDATNVIMPRVSVITALSMEHTAILGDTLPQIAMEKAGIIKPNTPVVMAPQKEEASQVISSVATERDAHLTCVSSDYHYKGGESTLDGQSFQVLTPRSVGGEWVSLYIPLLGAHQLENATTAYAALDVLRRDGFCLHESQIQKGFAVVDWPARFEILHRSPPIIVDAGHIPDSIQKINATLDELFPGKPVILVFGVSEDKDVDGMFREIMPRVREVICTQSTHPRALDSEVLRDLALPFGRPATAVANTGSALELAIEVAGTDALVLVTGSIFVAATARIAWQERLQYKYQNQLEK